MCCRVESLWCHISTVSELWVKSYPVVKGVCERDRGWVHCGKSQGDAAECVFFFFLSWAAAGSELFWSEFVVVIHSGENNVSVSE